MILRQNVKTRQVVLICVLLVLFTSLALVYQRTGRDRLEEYYDRLSKAAHGSGLGSGDHDSEGSEPGSKVVGSGDHDSEGSEPGSKLARVGKDRFRLLLPASNAEINLCKTMMTAHALGYPTPTLIGYHESYDHAAGMMAGGSHVMKVLGVLEYLEALDSSADDDLVMMMDAYGAFDYYDNVANKDAHREADIWFQLRVETLIERYYAINAAENKRIRERLGRAAEVEGIEQTIVFGSGKRCAPNQLHTVACYPVHDSPIPMDTYGTNTDTIMGRNKYASLRQRWLNSGIIMGPVKDLRPMFKRALEKIEKLEDHPEWDNGSGGMDFMYHGSDQSIFNTMLGEQEFQRWVMRLRHMTEEDKARGFGKLPSSYIEGTLIDNPINPSFTHEIVEHKAGKPDEFGIGLDYFSELGQQTVNSEEDARWLYYNRDIAPQISNRDGLFDCPSRVKGLLPHDVANSDPPLSGFTRLEQGSGDADDWANVPLYTNLCLDTIPVMIHHNGNKDAREFQWPELWVQQHARTVMADVLKDGEGGRGQRKGGAQLKDGTFIGWKELCSFGGDRKMEWELFRDVDREPDW